MAELAVEVVVQINDEDVLAGKLWSHRRRNSESSTFAYDDAYLIRPDAYALDPALPLVAGQQQTPIERAIFGAFSDCAPDRWGRRLIKRAEQQRVEREGGTAQSFGEIDYLLGVRDDMRQGALRFRLAEGEYLTDDAEGVPPLLELSRLLGAADRLERDEADEEELRMLLRGGSSLGGARPKAHVLDFDSRPAIAKFPSPVDEWDVIRWESVALKLAGAAGIDVPDSTVHIVDQKPVLVVDRFDRAGSVRIGYVSAMTMLEATDGDGSGSYLDIVDVIERNSPATERDLEQLWRRIAFSILISNTDDHLRNHGFLRTSSAGWMLSPAFDLNPNPAPGPKQLSTAIDFDDTSASVKILVGVADYFRLDTYRYRQVLGEVLEATARWRTVAAQAGINRAAIDQMAPAFEHGEVALAAELVRS